MRTRADAELEGLQARYIEELRVRRYSPSALEKARFELPRLVEHLARQGVCEARGVTEAHLAAYARELSARPTRSGAALSAATRASILTTIRGFFAHLGRGGYLLRNPASAIPLPRCVRLTRRILTERQARRLMAAPHPSSRNGKRDRAILETLYGTGVRLGEAVRADVSDLDVREGLLLVRSGKGKKDRVVPVGGRAAAALGTYLDESRPQLLRHSDAALFISRHGRRLSLVGLRAVVRRHGDAIGLRVSPHALRHTCATHLLRGGADIRHVQELLGHHSITTTALYTRVVVDDLRQVLAHSHPRRHARR